MPSAKRRSSTKRPRKGPKQDSAEGHRNEAQPEANLGSCSPDIAGPDLAPNRTTRTKLLENLPDEELLKILADNGPFSDRLRARALKVLEARQRNAQIARRQSKGS